MFDNIKNIENEKKDCEYKIYNFYYYQILMCIYFVNKKDF